MISFSRLKLFGSLGPGVCFVEAVGEESSNTITSFVSLMGRGAADEGGDGMVSCENAS